MLKDSKLVDPLRGVLSIEMSPRISRGLTGFSEDKKGHLPSTYVLLKQIYSRLRI
jgi:hypothetical protein